MNILIDMIKLRAAMIENPSITLPEAYFYPDININGLKTIRELAAFSFSCRRCEDAPCISVCPAEALEKVESGIIERHTNLCVSCKSCVTICPFGTMMSDFFEHRRNRDNLYDLNFESDIARFIMSCPEGTVTLIESEEVPENNIYRLNEKVLIRDFVYSTEKQ